MTKIQEHVQSSVQARYAGIAAPLCRLHSNSVRIAAISDPRDQEPCEDEVGHSDLRQRRDRGPIPVGRISPSRCAAPCSAAACGGTQLAPRVLSMPREPELRFSLGSNARNVGSIPCTLQNKRPLKQALNDCAPRCYAKECRPGCPSLASQPLRAHQDHCAWPTNRIYEKLKAKTTSTVTK